MVFLIILGVVIGAASILVLSAALVIYILLYGGYGVMWILMKADDFITKLRSIFDKKFKEQLEISRKRNLTFRERIAEHFNKANKEEGA